jgi:hypothetical protein
MIVLLISLVWLVSLTALVYRLATRAGRAPASLERSPRLLVDSSGADFEEAIGAILASKPAAAKDVRDRAQHDLYVGP